MLEKGREEKKQKVGVGVLRNYVTVLATVATARPAVLLFADAQAIPWKADAPHDQQ